jgi:hypothetical protein
MNEKIFTIASLIKLNKILDSLGYVDLNVYEAFELYKFTEEMKLLYSFLEQNTDKENFESVSKNYISFILPDISFKNIINNSEIKPTEEEVEFLKTILKE